ncbi:ADP-ribosylation factor GTPase-activating protein 3 [Trichinella spiralis]|uniref:ADP-ribosylation factor GTPase-activating protein 3 n=1 Tax=Trichinella spiralis TaxID=6334 RepID=UPI0001EFEE1D|nr:ADP-ribosylation factor GTPase-activating protein 3 [Trichinella spiralis]
MPSPCFGTSNVQPIKRSSISIISKRRPNVNKKIFFQHFLFLLHIHNCGGNYAYFVKEDQTALPKTVAIALAAMGGFLMGFRKGTEAESSISFVGDKPGRCVLLSAADGEADPTRGGKAAPVPLESPFQCLLLRHSRGRRRRCLPRPQLALPVIAETATCTQLAVTA